MDAKLISLNFYNVVIKSITKNGNAFVDIFLPDSQHYHVLIRRTNFNVLFLDHSATIVGAIVDTDLPDKNGNTGTKMPVFKTLKF